MILTAHFLTGAVLATKIQNPILGLFLAPLSHYFLDFIPHREYLAFPKHPSQEKWKGSIMKFLKISVDFLIGVSIAFILSENKLLALTGGFLAILPDFDNIAFLFPNLLKNRLFKYHFDFHLEPLHHFVNKKSFLFLGIFSQILVILIAIYFLR